jgi:hypothetical protein
LGFEADPAQGENWFVLWKGGCPKAS